MSAALHWPLIPCWLHTSQLHMRSLFWYASGGIVHQATPAAHFAVCDLRQANPTQGSVPGEAAPGTVSGHAGGATPSQAPGHHGAPAGIRTGLMLGGGLGAGTGAAAAGLPGAAQGGSQFHGSGASSGGLGGSKMLDNMMVDADAITTLRYIMEVCDRFDCEPYIVVELVRQSNVWMHADHAAGVAALLVALNLALGWLCAAD